MAAINDVGLRAVIRDGVKGFSMTVAGGLGPLPVEAKLLHEFIPAEDVVLLPIANTTAEMLAWWLAQELRGSPTGILPAGATLIEVEVEESFGQRAVYRERLGGA